MNFYPNPVNSSLTGKIQSISNESNLSVEIYNLQGNLLFEATTGLVGGTFTLDVESLEKGLYILKTEGNDVNYTGKFFKE